MKLQVMVRLLVTGLGIIGLGIVGCTQTPTVAEVREQTSPAQSTAETAQNSAPVQDIAPPAPSPDLDVPYVPTPQAVVNEMLRIANVNQDDVLYDLGSGDGRIVITAARNLGLGEWG